ncbi:MAG: ribonuclease P protein component [Deltaproteobacteria bacterium]|nr:MAG: ribonuclease P protein component [Deltaproteobacteria bacterium]RLB74599.1 MAG: ribonuclease P protein component [Deltaproteobacteria bacterium]
MNSRPIPNYNECSQSLSKKERLLNRSDFVNLNRSGERLTTEHFVVLTKPNGLGIRRVGITVTRKTANAVRRNRIKRLIREFFRLNKAKLPQGHDFVFIARKDASRLTLSRITEELGAVLFENNNLG